MADPEDWLFKRARNGDEHIRNCSDGYSTASSAKENKIEIHHCLCVHACSDETFPDDLTEEQIDFIHASLAQTEWNINSGDNNIGLPRKWAYINDPDNDTAWDGYPCHQVDHDLYLENVEEYVTDKIWNSLLNSKKGKKCEKIDGKTVAGKFNAGSTKYKSFLTARGVGTKKSLDYCQSGKVKEPMESSWHIPFSMAVPVGDVRPRAKPPANTTWKRAGFLNIEED